MDSSFLNLDLSSDANTGSVLNQEQNGKQCKMLPDTIGIKTGKRKDQGVPQSQTAALPRHQEEEETDKIKQVQIEQTYEKH